ncbi:adenine-specific DNA methylase containing azn-ribbon [Actinomyces sp. Chiba101]|uniref:DUF1156 domain-containing protein n=1 Tax=Actinomyces TaxID=1654 RepID=UPI000974F44C|nr:MULTISPECIES: DUF1156 domain-containing protein [Actinomyces]BAW92197.1 adenine-specific DNA methylase containing azn-ribbon [Actinomyces sp. Chiba101]GAV94864.1 adenine-specific DNA methylase containing a Zn-ribbon [Actinomyces denticolens]SUU10676.1 Protein of uncharacterised function (DUF1156) [Actinomyces denticolens]
MPRKLIEVALPLDAINAQSAREKSIRKGHPSTLHLWWSRKPTATARAVLFSQLVDDPSERYEEFREAARAAGDAEPDAAAERAVEAERRRLFTLITRMVDWDNLTDEHLMREVRAEIRRSTGGELPAVLDPFAGGGSIPLEAQRLGLEARASDLNPVAVLINKALIEIPPRFASRAPVFPEADDGTRTWPGAHGLAEDVRRYGQWMREEAWKRIGHLYPAAELPDGTTATVIAWIWARTVTCPNPACGIETPLVSKWWLGKKKGKEAYIVPTIVGDHVEYSIGHDPAQAPSSGTVAGGKGRCLACSTLIDNACIRSQATSRGLGQRLIAIAAEGGRRREYLAPTAAHADTALGIPRPTDVPMQEVPKRNHDVDRLPMYGMPTWSDAFTSRQLTALTTFSDLVGEARERVLRDALANGMEEGERLEAGGAGAAAYADAVATYLGFAVSRLTDYSSALNTWANNPQMEILRNVFARQALPMAWDFAEGNPFASSSGSLSIMIKAVSEAVSRTPANAASSVLQADASSRDYASAVISTDPPYYDNIGYSDLSDFFYVWLRRSLKGIHPSLFSTMLVPKAEELVANPYRHGGKDGAKDFFEDGFRAVFARARQGANPDYPMTVYYAFKQSETTADGRTSTGWSTILEGMIGAGWTITATWPMRSERGGRMTGVGTNALASSIVLVLRPRPEDAPMTDRRSLMRELRRTLPDAVETLRSGGIAPVDLAQAAIGPGMSVFSRYARVIGPDGTNMTVSEALTHINTVLDEVLSEQEGDLDADTRWCLTWYDAHGFTEGPYGEAETLASARNASIDALKRSGVLNAGGGRVSLIAPCDLPDGYDPRTDDRISHWEVVLHLARTLKARGIDDAGRILAGASHRGLEMDVLQPLAYRLYSLAERHGRTEDGLLFNDLGGSWPEIAAAARTGTGAGSDAQTALDLDTLKDD